MTGMSKQAVLPADTQVTFLSAKQSSSFQTPPQTQRPLQLAQSFSSTNSFDAIREGATSAEFPQNLNCTNTFREVDSKFAKTVLLLIMACILTLAFCLTTPSKALADDSDEKVVEVAYVIIPSFQDGGEGEYKTGEGYEYLQNIAGYAGWTYEYVYGSFDELLQMLENGEVALMGNVSYTVDRAQLVSYGSFEQGKESFYLFTKGNESNIRASDYSTINGKRVGVSASTYQEELWKKWCSDNSVDCQIVEYPDSDARQAALNNGEVDAVIGSTAHGATDENENWNAVLRFSEAPYFFCVSKDRPDLLSELNEAQEKILSENPFYNEQLSHNYSQANSITTKQLSDDEIAWIKSRDGLIRIGCIDNYMPLSDKTEAGEVKGVVPDLLSEIESAYQDYGVHFEISTYTDYNKMMDDLRNGVIDLAPVYGDYWNADRENTSLTSAFMSTTMLMLNEGSYSPGNLHKIGFDSQSPLQTVYAAIHSSEYEWIEYPTMKDAANALHKGEVDGALCTACSYHVFAKTNDVMKNQNRVTLPGKVNVAMAISKSNPALRSFMNRGISIVGETKIFNSLALNSNVDKKTTITDLVIDNPGKAFLTILAALIAIAVVAFKLHKAVNKSHTDSMTGLLNKPTMLKTIDGRFDEGGILFVIDIDNFKAVNDKLGHQTGDQIINHLSSVLKDTFRTTDLLGRFGGDEFMVFLPGLVCDSGIAERKASQLRKEFESESSIIEHPEIGCSISIGAVCISPNEGISLAEAFEKADTALYEAKKNGKRAFAMAR